jgi:hypothetical protein
MTDNHNPYIDFEDARDDLNNILEEENFFTLNLDIYFRAEILRGDLAFERKMRALFEDINFCECKTERQGGHTLYRVVLDKENFTNFVNHKSYGVFEDDYTVTVLGFNINFRDNMTAYRAPDSPIKKASYAEALKKGSENNLTIMVRKGRDPIDQPARGLHTFNILSDMNEILRVLNHFNINGKVSQVSRATPSLPSLEIQLTSTLLQMMTDGIINKEPLMIYKPTPQSELTGCTELWAHAETLQGTSPKRVTIEGAGGRVDIEDLKHELSYSGEVLGELIPQTWANEGPLAGVLNGDLVLYMRLDLQFNWVFVNNHAFKCIYTGQSLQCSVCYSWEHKAGACGRRGESRRDLLRQYQSKWKRQVAYAVRGGAGTDTATPTAITPSTTGATTPTATSTTPATSGTATPATTSTTPMKRSGASTTLPNPDTNKEMKTISDPKPMLKISDKVSTPKEDEKVDEAGKKHETSGSKHTPKPTSLSKTPAGQGHADPKKLNPETITKPSDTTKPQNYREDTHADTESKPTGNQTKPKGIKSASSTMPPDNKTKPQITGKSKPADTETKPTEIVLDDPMTTIHDLDNETEHELEIDVDKDDRDPTKILNEYENKYNNAGNAIKEDDTPTFDEKASLDKKRKRKDDKTTPNKAAEEETAKKNPANPPSPKASIEPGDYNKK